MTVKCHSTGSPDRNASIAIEEIEEITTGIPDEQLLEPPVDRAEQRDHEIYATPKRPPSQ